MKMSYLAYDTTGRAIRDVIEAASPQEATDQLRKRGLFVTSVDETTNAPTPVAGPRRSIKLFQSHHKQVMVFTRQLHVLTSTGTTLADALSALARQAKDPKWKARVVDIQNRVEQGNSLAEAMEHHEDVFDTIYRSLIAAGETSGKFDQIVDRLAVYVKKQAETRGAVIGALVYPALLLAVATSVLILMLAFVLPRFAELFESLDAPLPPSTQFLLFLGDVLRGYWWALLLGIAGAVVGGWFWLQSTSGVFFRDTVAIKIPLFGKLVRSFILARLLRMMGTLLDSFVPLIDVLELAKKAAGNLYYRQLIERIQDAVSRGEAISSAMEDATLVDPAVQESIKSGEDSGRLSTMMLSMADFMDEENETTLKSLTSILEPVILIVLGVLVALVALSMFLPLFDLTATAGGGH